MLGLSFKSYYRGGIVDTKLLGQSLPQLPDTEYELKTVAQKLGVPASDIILGRDASETRLKKMKLRDYKIVYFATHALVAGDLEHLGVKDKAEPALVLSVPANGTSLDDGLLTASEVALLKLNADWVVLSACNTAAGNKPGAEALSGLARAFFYSGARSLLVSHWPVVSDAAVKLTTKLFELKADNPELDKAEALRKSMLSLMNDTSDPLNAYPAMWAPFIIVGE
jgi:CHAT domain-containing protein